MGPLKLLATQQDNKSTTKKAISTESNKYKEK